MKKNIKHRFTHADPETIKEIDKSTGNTHTKQKPQIDSATKIIKRDLKRSLLTILGFVILLIVFFVINNKYNLLATLRNIFS